jgi:hypothetical protein
MTINNKKDYSHMVLKWLTRPHEKKAADTLPQKWRTRLSLLALMRLCALRTTSTPPTGTIFMRLSKQGGRRKKGGKKRG